VENKAIAKTEKFDETTSVALVETSASAVAEQARAVVNARYLMAIRRPRSLDDVRVKMLKACDRPRFAEAAIYKKPIGNGKTIEGPSARFAEEALRALGNVMPEAYAVYEDHDKKIVRVSMTDLEVNLTHTQDITVTKTVERSYVKTGQKVFSKRINSYGKPVFTVRATDDELRNKETSLISKMRRNLALMLLPSDIKEECIDRCYDTKRDSAAQDPDWEKKRLVDAFAKVGVTPVHLSEYLSHSLDAVQPAEILELRSIHSAIHDGEAVWSDFIETKNPNKKEDKSKTDKVKNLIKKKNGNQNSDKPLPAWEKAREVFRDGEVVRIHDALGINEHGWTPELKAKATIAWELIGENYPADEDIEALVELVGMRFEEQQGEDKDG